MSEQAPELPQEMLLPDGRRVTVVDLSDEASRRKQPLPPNTRRSLLALIILGTGTIVLSVGVGGLFGVYAGLTAAGCLLVAVGFLLALT